MRRTARPDHPRTTRRHRAVLLAVVVAAVALGAFGGVAPAGAASAPKPMSTARARTVYLGAVCPFNALQAERTKVLADLQAGGTPVATGDPMPEALRATSAQYAKLAERAYAVFADPPAPWPTALRTNFAVATAYAAVLAERAKGFEAATRQPDPPTWETLVAAQKVNLPLLRAGLGIAAGTDPCAGRSASGVTIQTVPDGVS